MKIYITENQKNKLFLIQEGISDKLYHFTDIESVESILKNNMIALSMSANRADAKHKTKFFYLSCQRSKNNKLGYAHSKSNKKMHDITLEYEYLSSCRIELDGYKLKSDGYKGGPVDYWNAKGDQMGLEAAKKMGLYNQVPGPYSILRQQKNNTYFEMEDRFVSSKPYIENASRYIVRIDIFDVNGMCKTYEKCINYGKQNNIAVFVYDNINNYNMQNDKFINTNNYITKKSEIIFDDYLNAENVFKSLEDLKTTAKNFNISFDTILHKFNIIPQNIETDFQNEIFKIREARDFVKRNGSLKRRIHDYLIYWVSLYVAHEKENSNDKINEIINKFDLKKFIDENDFDSIIEKSNYPSNYIRNFISLDDEDFFRHLPSKYLKEYEEEFSNVSFQDIKNILGFVTFILNLYNVSCFSRLRNKIENPPKEKPIKMDSVNCVEIVYFYDETNRSVLLGEHKFTDYFHLDQIIRDLTTIMIDYGNIKVDYYDFDPINHKSKNNWSFISYISHTLSKCNIYDGVLLLDKILTKKNWDYMFGFYAKPLTITLNNLYDYRSNFSFSDGFEIEKRLNGWS